MDRPDQFLPGLTRQVIYFVNPVRAKVPELLFAPPPDLREQETVHPFITAAQRVDLAYDPRRVKTELATQERGLNSALPGMRVMFRIESDTVGWIQTEPTTEA